MAKTIKYTIFQTKWGYFGIAGTDRGLLRTQLPVQVVDKAMSLLLKDLERARYEKGFLRLLQKQIIAYFNGSYVNFSKQIPVILDSFSNFTAEVLQVCRNIKYAEKGTYGELAKEAGRPGAARAVGRVLAMNPAPLIIPCHRVICSDGLLGGFSNFGGIELKKRLLALERRGCRKHPDGS